jgi:hypothetical protein
LDDLTSESHQQGNWVIELFRSHPALLVPVIYVVASTIGMLYSWDYLRLFGINVFNYAQIGDFLLASLKEPFTWLIVVASVFLVIVDNEMSRRVERKSKWRFLAWYGSGRYRMINIIASIAMIVFFTHFYAMSVRDSVLGGKTRLINVRLTESATDNQFVLLGTTGTFIFLYEPFQNEVSIHPHESIYSISFQADQ